MKKLIFALMLVFSLPLLTNAQGKFHVAIGTGHTIDNSHSMWTGGYAAGWQFNNRFDIGWDFKLNSSTSDLKDGGTISKNWNGVNVGYNLSGKADFQVEPFVGYYFDMANRVDGEKIPNILAYRLKVQKAVSKVTSIYIQGGHYKYFQCSVGVDLRTHN